MTTGEAVEKYIIEKLRGNGQCECYGCKQKKGWNRVWTSLCYRYKGKIYCSKCIEEILNESFSPDIS